MIKSRPRAVLYGGLGGGLLGLSSLALVGGRYSLGSAVAVPVAEGSARADVGLAVSTGGLYLAVVVVGLLAGLAIAGVAYGVGRESEPSSPRFPLRYLLPVAGAISTIVAYGALRAGLGAFGEIDEGIATISVLSFTLIAVAAGALAGAVTGDAVDRLARPQLLGFEGAAWPQSSAALIGEMARAVATPVVALIVAAAFAVPLSQILLEAEGTLAVAIFSTVGAIVLGGAALLAYRPWDRNGASSTEH